MTPHQTHRVIRSLQYREELSHTIPTLKAQLMTLVQERGPCIVGGYRVWHHEGQLIVKQLPVIPINQLPLTLEFLNDSETVAEAEISTTELCLSEGICYQCEQPLETPRNDCDCPCHSVIQ